ncbi:hypothetical protein BJ878DRAFT_281555 [Calycina marina]|uniref:Bromo domain-containing protein n=1 Tax=Calycina marina TaxID=1763456 RepID=A0A9P7Z6X5_9HELO|nr:hypothetical protein BJ878DRAFT_281555 [Calycina marina]
MNSSMNYTPLESLLLGQYLEAYGANEGAFNTISSLLSGYKLIQEDESFDRSKLDPVSLKGHYLNLLGEELRDDGGYIEDSGSGKRTAATPPRTLQDAHRHANRIPGLVDRLYVRYGKHVAATLAEDERRCYDLQREIAEIERGEWDEKILAEERSTKRERVEDKRAANGTNSVGSQPRASEDPARQSPTPTQRPSSRPDGLGIDDMLLNYHQEPPGATQDPTNGNTNASPAVQSPSISGTRGLSPLQPPLQHSISSSQLRWEPPFDPARQHQPPSNFQPQYYQNGLNPYQPQQSFPPQNERPGPPQYTVPSSPLAAQQPVMLPALGGAPRQPGSPALDHLADAASQHHPSQGSCPPMQPPNQHGPYPPHGPPTHVQYRHQGSQSPGYYPQYAPQLQRPGSGQSQNGQPQRNQQIQPPSQNSPQHPQQPFYPAPSQQPQHQQYQNLPPVSPQRRSEIPNDPNHNSPYHLNQAPRHLLPGQGSHGSVPSTPRSTVSSRFSTGRGTQWTEKILGSSTPKVQNQAYENSPAYEPLSPPMPNATLPKSSKIAILKRATKESKQKAAVTNAKSKPPNRKLLDISVASSVPTSIMSQNESHVKEEVITPGLPDEDARSMTADDLPRLRNNQKRKRSMQSVPNSPIIPRESAIQVLWTRNFSRICPSALEQVISHKHAALFKEAIKDKDAPGYSKIILRPQDLKSIKAAITNGNKAAIAAEALLPESEERESALWLPISEDLIPPKGIINDTQLERELMRMFANAVMFNADPSTRHFAQRLKSPSLKGGESGYEIDEDGVVNDTLEMFGDVEAIVSGLRDGGRIGESVKGKGLGSTRGASVRGSSVPATTDDGEDEASNAGGSVAKRRRKG